jgi:acyl carrier protein
MDNAEARLVRCFQVNFPALDEQQVRHASTASVDTWDSVAMVTLINLVEEEFGIQIDLEDVEKMVSFDQFLGYLRAREAA